MPFLLGALGSIGGAIGGGAGAAGSALGSAAGGLGSALGSAGSAVGSGLGSAASTVGSGLGQAGGAVAQGLSQVPDFLGAGGGEAGRIAALGQEVPAGVDIVGPGSLTPGDAAVMFGGQNVPQSFKPGILAQLKNSDLLMPILLSLSSQGQSQQPTPAPAPSVETPTFEPAGFPAMEDDPLAFLRAFHIQG